MSTSQWGGPVLYSWPVHSQLSTKGIAQSLPAVQPAVLINCQASKQDIAA